MRYKTDSPLKNAMKDDIPGTMQKTSVWILRSRNWVSPLNLTDKFTEYEIDSDGPPSLFHTALTAHQQEELRSIMNRPDLREDFRRWEYYGYVLCGLAVLISIILNVQFYSGPVIFWILVGIMPLLGLGFSVLLMRKWGALKRRLVMDLNESAGVIQGDFQWRSLDLKEGRQFVINHYRRTKEFMPGLYVVLEFSIRPRPTA